MKFAKRKNHWIMTPGGRLVKITSIGGGEYLVKDARSGEEIVILNHPPSDPRYRATKRKSVRRRVKRKAKRKATKKKTLAEQLRELRRCLRKCRK